MRKISRFYKDAIMQNLGLFIALGLLNVLFSRYGWFPNIQLRESIKVMSQIIIPIFIAYSCGKQSGGELGASVSVIAMLGIIVKEDTYGMFAAMLMGPLLGMMSKGLYERLKEKIPAGFEMLVKNLFIGIVGVTALLFTRSVVIFGIRYLYEGLYKAADYLVVHNMIVGLPVIVEPLKVLFLNNSMNHGILTPIGMQQMYQTGKSVFFLVETNPGPGLGILLAMLLYHKTERKKYASYALFESIGGIHEVYFPYILARPMLIFAAIAGGISGMFVFERTGAGAVSVISPGSCLLFLLLSAKGDILWTGIGMLVSTVVSFGISILILKQSKKETWMMDKKDTKIEKKEKPNYICFVCDAGFGSSAMAASLFKKRLKKEEIEGICVEHASIEHIPETADIVFAQKSFEPHIKDRQRQTTYYFLESVMQDPVFETLINQWK